MSKANTYNFIDLFAGCGGLSEGFYREGFKALAHVEWNHVACCTLKTRMKHYGYKNADNDVIETDITVENINELISNVVGTSKVDVIIGGPPCQAYSSAGRARDYHGMQEDSRNFLFESYVKILNKFLPKMFVFENVSGILTANVKGKKIINEVLKALGENYKVSYHLLNSVNYGVPQTRKRVIIIGIRNDIDCNVEDVYANIRKTHYEPDADNEGQKGLKKYVTVRDALFELPLVYPGGGEKLQAFEYALDNDFLKRIGSKKNNILMDHIARRHNDLDIERYKAMAGYGWTFEELLEKRPDLRHPKARIFGNSYVVQRWDAPSRTIIAHLYKDGNQFIHPDAEQGRTLTVREAARLQSFPDDFVFEGSRTEQYKQIGNAVPCLFAEAIAKGVLETLKEI